MKRVFLFIATNLAIIVLLSITLRILGVDSILDAEGLNLNVNALLVFSAVFGMGYFIVVIVAQLVLGVLASVIVFWFSRRREFRADAGAARLAGRDKMIAALESLKRSSEPPQLPKQIAAFGISGGEKGGIRRLFMTHPPLSERIAALNLGV